MKDVILTLFDSARVVKPARYIYRHSLMPVDNLKLIFRSIRDYFAGNVTGITRDEVIAQTIMRILFCKIYDEKVRADSEVLDIARRPNEEAETLKRRVDRLFEQVKEKYSDIFTKDEQITVNARELSWIVSVIEDYSLHNSNRDVIADAFEELIGTAFRGGEGQFFTPRNVVQMMIEVLNPISGERIIDPACGSGGFLVYILRHMLNKNHNNYFIAGIDKDAFLAKLAKIYLTIIGEEQYHIYCENSLENPSAWSETTRSNIELGTFDVVLTNPPFGAKIPVIGNGLLSQYELGHLWNFENNKWIRSFKIVDKQPPQILFIERCLQLLNSDGRMGIVLPEGIFGNPSERYIWQFIKEKSNVLGIVSLSQETFQPSTHTKTSVLFLTKKPTDKVFMSIAYSVGHNKNGKTSYKMKTTGEFYYDREGNKIINDDLPVIAKKFCAFQEGKTEPVDHLGYTLGINTINDDIYIPEYYNPEIDAELKSLESSGNYKLVKIKELVDSNLINIKRGNEIGSNFYGTGDIPFVRTTDIVNWEIKFDPVKSVSKEVYNRYKKLQDIKENDILFVNDGTFLIGRSALVTRLDCKVVIQSHLKRIRVAYTNEMNPFYLFYLLNTKLVKKQVEAKTFVQATISTLGNRLMEIMLPVHLNIMRIDDITHEIKEIIEQKTVLRERCLTYFRESA